jgi:hypothetical protein
MEDLMAANDAIRRGEAVDREAANDDRPANTSAEDYVSEYDVEETVEAGAELTEGLSIVNEDDPSLGLTNFRDKGPGDWAADTEQAHNPPSRLTTDHVTDRSSTLTPKR